MLVNRLKRERMARGWTQRQVADLAGVSRQSYVAIEAGRAIPSTEVSLRLADAFAKPVEQLFQLRDGVEGQTVVARWSGGSPRAAARVRLVRVGSRAVAVPAGNEERLVRGSSGTVTAVLDEDVEVTTLSDGPPEPALVVTGCDPAFGVVAESLWRERGIEALWTGRGSRGALEALSRGEAHIAGAHLMDPAGGGFNVGWVDELVPFPCTVVGFSEWEQCLIVAGGNPREIRNIEDLGRPGIRIVNREPGSGSRRLLDDLLGKAGIPGEILAGYGIELQGHMAVAEAVAAGFADAGIAIRAAARAYGLAGIPIREERYDLVIPDHFLDLPAIQMLLGTLRRDGVRRQIEALGGYDTAIMGREGSARAVGAEVVREDHRAGEGR